MRRPPHISRSSTFIVGRRHPNTLNHTNEFLFLLQAPAEGTIELKEVVFNPDFRSKEIYARPPSPEVDQAWDNLYKGQHSMIRGNLLFLAKFMHAVTPDVQDLQIPKHQAELLHNKTAAVSADPDNYIIALAVFHQLHCLVSLNNRCGSRFRVS